MSFKPANPIGLEGIAVDPAKERVYVLAVTLRGEAASIDPATRAAETLYAFKTKQSGGKLESAVSGGTTEDQEGVLASSKTLETESEVQGHALLEPSGIAVDPTTHDVIIMGWEDQGAKGVRVALQRVSETGTLVSRYVDTTDCFGGQGSAECKEGAAKQPTSPVVSQTGRVYVESFDQIWEIPSDFTSTQPPKVFIQFNSFTGEQIVEGSVEELVEFPGEPVVEAGGGLSLVPEGATEGTIYAYADIAQDIDGKRSYKYPGALAFKYVEKAGVTKGAEIGWTGGQSKASGGGKCTISFLASPSVAAGKGHDLFVLNPAAPDVVTFGPGGSGCPVASATIPSMKVKGQAVTEVPAGAKVTLSSTISQANALSVEWNFGDGDTETVSTDEFQTTKVTHEYKLGGEHTITETIHTDDLQTPEVVVQGTLKVTGGNTTEAVKITSQPVAREVTEGETATFTAAAAGIPTPTVQWQLSTNAGGTWSDLPGATSDTLNVEHTTVSESGYEYRVVFTNEVSKATTTAATLNVKEEEHKVEKPKEEEPKKEEPKVEKHKEEKSGEPIVSPIGSKEPLGWPEEPLVSPLPAGSSPAGGGSVLGGQTHGSSPAPDAELASTTLTTNTAGAISLVVSCPAGESSCAGTVTLRTLGAVSARKKKGTATVLTLARGSFTVAGGATQPITLHLSGQARALLAQLRVLRVIATIVAHDATGATHTTQATVTLHAPKAKHGKG